MRRRLGALAAVGLGVACVAGFVCCRRVGERGPRPADAPVPAVEGEASQSSVSIPSGPYRLRGEMFRPRGAGPARAVVYNHGSERDPSLDFHGGVGRWFRDHGYVVLFPYRRGAAGSEGPYWEDTVNALPADQRKEAVVRALDEENDDVLAAIRWLKAQPFVDGRHIAVAGCSFGGIETLITAERSPDVYAAIDFAGASMSWAGSEPLRNRLTRAARAARAPVFFLQAENDFNTAPSLTLAAVMQESGKEHRVHVFPPHGTTHMQGHAGFCNHGMAEWGDEVLAFLDAAGARGREP